MTLAQQQALEADYMMPTFARKPVEFVRGQGMELFDDAGKRYLDFIGGIGVISLGHCHPALTSALAKQTETLMHVSNYYHIEGRGELSRTLSDLLNARAEDTANAPAWRTFFSNSGAESNECAIKLARLRAKRAGRGTTVVVLKNSFHGRTLATLAATAQPLKQEAFAPLPGGFVSTPINDVEALTTLFDEQGSDICAVLLEVIQGESGVHPCTPEFMQAVRDLTAKHDALMMCDEVQCGIFRCGTYPFAFQHYGIMPDVVTMAKGIGAGMPMGACAARGDFGLTFAPGDHGTTFGGSCLAIAAATTTLETIEKEGLAENAEVVGAYLREKLAELPHIKEVRGKGLMVAAEFEDCVDAGKLVLNAFSSTPGLVLNCTGAHTLRFLPPLVCTAADVDAMVAALKELVEAQA